uniref:Protein FAM221A n=1 Tax=Neogobius melanostomus TaxID=47308 RepID=A0A8C6WU34_9GOBI
RLQFGIDHLYNAEKIVGDDDGGTLFTPQQYEEYKRTQVPRRMQNRLYVSFGVPGGLECKLIGPETPCFCVGVEVQVLRYRCWG